MPSVNRLLGNSIADWIRYWNLATGLQAIAGNMFINHVYRIFLERLWVPNMIISHSITQRFQRFGLGIMISRLFRSFSSGANRFASRRSFVFAENIFRIYCICSPGLRTDSCPLPNSSAALGRTLPQPVLASSPLQGRLLCALVRWWRLGRCVGWQVDRDRFHLVWNPRRNIRLTEFCYCDT